MSELEQVRKMAKELAAKTEHATTAELALALEKVTQTFKSFSEVEKSQAETRKLTTDEQKIRHDLEHASKQERLESRQRYITILTPIATVLVLGLTLGSQTYQFVKSERDKREASEDTQWSEAVKTVSQSAKLSPIAIALNPFLKSKRYSEVARKTAVQVLVNTHEPTVFADLFTGAFVPIGWENFDAVLQLDRGLGSRLAELATKSFDQATQDNDLSRLSKDEQNEYRYIIGALKEISAACLPLLKATRPKGQNVDLRSAWFQECDWSGVNLNDADITDIKLRYAILKDADLGGISSFRGVDVFRTAWWEANRISPELLEYLVNKYPYDAQKLYGPNDIQVSQQTYDNSLARLKTSK